MFQILAQSFPNNEIRINYTRIKAPSSYFSEVFDTCEPDGRGDGVRAILPVGSDTDLSEEIEALPPLSLVPNSKTRRSSAGYGDLPSKPTTFGLNAKRQLIRAGGALEKSAPPEECLFLTGTLPGSTEDAFKAIAAYSGYIVNSLKAWIATRVKSKLDFYCWEYQKRGALHLHYCVHCPDGTDRDFILNGFRSWWISVLSRVGELGRCDLFRKNSGKTWLSDLSKVRAVAEICRKSPARYLAKYLSKSAAPKRGSARAFTPSRWWGTSRPLKSLLASMTKTMTICVAGYHQSQRVRESVVHEVDSSESVTFRYQHKFGIGDTSVSYPSSDDENRHLWQSLRALSIMKLENSEQNLPPSEILKVHRDKVLTWALNSQAILSPSHQGLRESLNQYSNMVASLTPSKSPEPLQNLLCWAARTSDILSLSKYTPALSREDEKMLRNCLDALDVQMNIVAKYGWS